MIRYFGRLLKTPDHRLMKKVYIWDKKLNENQHLFSWTNEIKSILYNCNLNNVYDAQLMFPVKTIVKQLEESLYKMQLVRVENICRNRP